MRTSIHDCKVINLPKISERKGALTPIYGREHIPFEIQRVFYLYDVPGGEGRGAHAHKTLHQFIVSVMGAFDVVMDNGFESKRIRLDRAYYGLYIPPMIWAHEENFSSGGICLVLASAHYDEADYIRDYATFVEAAKDDQ
jgi:hypothetical protein